jgi:peroxiredoxin
MTYAQQTLPSVDLKTLDGKSINTKDLSNEGKPFAVCFWATWCKPCLMELSTFAELYEEWQEETGMKIFAVSIDDSRTQSKVQPLVNTAEWEYEVLLDVNSEFKRAMGVNNPPHTFVVNGKGEIVWQHVGYAPGDEEGLIEAIRKVIAEQK